MTQASSQPNPASGKGEKFFDRADEVAQTGNWDFAIALYLEGIAREPDNIERGHQPLREVSLKRKAMGGKGPGIVEKLKRRPGKDPVTSLVNGEYLLAKEPGSAQYMEHVLKAAMALKLPNVTKWICDILLEAERQVPKRHKRLLFVLVEAYSDMEDYAPAIEACDMAREFAPNDSRLQQRSQELSAKYTIKKGKYDQDGDFARSVKDLDEQKRLVQKDALVKDSGYLQREIEETRKEYLALPTVSGKILAYVDALTALEEERYEDEAIQVLKKAHQDTGAYQFKMRIGDIRIRQMSRQRRQALEDGNKEAAAELARRQLQFELQEFAERAANYPTDVALKYELARRHLAAGQNDEAIALFQHALRDPRRRVMASNYLGQAFARKGWYREAAETFEKVLSSEMPEERAKEIHYNLGDVLEKMNELARAQDEFSMVAQIDYNYKDVRQRLEAIRLKLGGSSEGP